MNLTTAVELFKSTIAGASEHNVDCTQYKQIVIQCNGGYTVSAIVDMDIVNIFGKQSFSESLVNGSGSSYMLYLYGAVYADKIAINGSGASGWTFNSIVAYGLK